MREKPGPQLKVSPTAPIRTCRAFLISSGLSRCETASLVYFLSSLLRLISFLRCSLRYASAGQTEREATLKKGVEAQRPGLQPETHLQGS
jgi:hypothetical protein